jgi:hypothetical protein
MNFYQLIYILLIVNTISISSFAQRPPENYPDYQPSVQNSALQAPITLAVSTLETEINKQLKSLIYQTNALDTKGYGTFAVKVWKIEPIFLTGEENTNMLLSRTALKIWVKGDYQTEVLGLGVSYPIEQTVSLRIQLKTDITLNKNWQAETKSQLIEYQWIEEPSLDFGLVKIPLTSIMDRVIKDQQASLMHQFDEQIKQYLQIRPQIEQAWRTFQAPMPVAEFRKDSTWLLLKPNDLIISNLQFKKQQLTTFLSLKTQAVGQIGEKPPFKYQALPAMKNEKINGNQVEFKILGKISRQLAIQKAKEIFMPEVYEYKNYKSKIKDLNIYGNGDLMVIELWMEGSIDGKIYLMGKPVYDRKSQSLQIIDLKYKLEGTGAFSKFAEWLFRGRIKKQIEKAIEEPVNAQIQAIRAEIEKNLANYKPNPTTLIQGTLSDFYFDKIVLTETDIFSEIYLKGNVNVSLLGF